MAQKSSYPPKKYSLGLDIGTNSIGWAVLDLEKERIHDLGVRIFSGQIENRKRRQFSSAQRINKRKKQRLKHLKTVFINNGLLSSDEINLALKDQEITENIYSLRAKAATQQISHRELFRVLYLIAKKRGFKSNRKSDPNDSDSSDTKFKKQLAKNSAIAEKYQTIGLMLENDPIYANQKHNSKDNYIATFQREDIRKEVEIILNKQFEKELNAPQTSDKYRNIIEVILDETTVDDNGEKQYLGMFTQRPYTNASLIEKMTGFCEFEKTERRYVKASYTTEEYVFLSNLSNIVILDTNNNDERYYIGKDDIGRLLALAKQEKNVKCSDVRKVLSLDKSICFSSRAIEDTYRDSIKHANKKYSAPQNKEKLAEALETARKIRDRSRKSIERQKVCEKGLGTFSIFKRLFKDSVLEQKIDENPYLLDDIAYILTVNIDDESIKTNLQQLEFLSDHDISVIMNMSTDDLRHFSGRSNLSHLAMQNIIKYLKEGYQSHLAIQKAGYDTKEIYQGNNITLPPLKLSDFSQDGDETFEKYGINSKVTQRALSQSIKLINAIIKKYGSPTYVRVELAREFAKTEEEREKIERNNKRNREKNRKYEEIINQIFKDNHKLPPSKIGHIIRKLTLRDQQDCKDIYSGDDIDITTLVLDESAYEIDHIIPRSKRFINDMNNLVLTSTKNNREKSNRLPLSYISDPTKQKEFLERVNLIKDKQKQKNLRLDSCEDQDNMTERALNDTKHIARFFKNYIQRNLLFAGDDEEDGRQRVFAIPGPVTAYLRARWGFEQKDRYANALHHAIDACVIVATTPKLLNRVMYHESHREQGKLYSERQSAEQDTGDFGMQAYLRAKKMYHDSIDNVSGEIIDPHKHNVAYEIMQEHEKLYRYSFPRPWIDFTREVSLRASDIDKKTLQNKLVEINNYDAEFRKTLHPIFISHMRYGKTRGSGHGEQIYKKPYKDDSRIIQHKSIYEISPDDIESSPIATSDRKLYELLKDTFSKIELKGNQSEKDKRIDKNTVIYKPSKNPDRSPVVKRIPVYVDKTPIPHDVRGGAVLNEKGTVAYSILCQNSTTGHYKVAPVYFRQIHANKKTELGEGWKYISRIVPNDFVVIIKKDGSKISGYYKTRKGDTLISILPHQHSDSSKAVYQRIGTAKEIHIYNISALGDNAPEEEYK
jgi:CRISPR-associated protein, csn1 family